MLQILLSPRLIHLALKDCHFAGEEAERNFSAFFSPLKFKNLAVFLSERIEMGFSMGLTV